MTRSEAQNLLSNKYVDAMLKVIRKYEASNKYNLYVGGITFNSYADHPYPVQINYRNPTSAAGAYQFVKGTWESIKKTLGLTDFGINSQDIAAVYNINSTGSAMKHILANEPDKAMDSLKGQWEVFTQDKKRPEHVNYFNTLVGNKSNNLGNVLFFTNGATSDISQQLKDDLNRAAKDTGIKKITIQFSRNGGHAGNSRHGKGQAVDIQYIDDKHVGTVNWAKNLPGPTAEGDGLARQLMSALGNYGYRKTTSESGTAKAIIYLSAGHYNHLHISNNGSEPDTKEDVISDNGDTQETPEQIAKRKDLKLNLDALEANIIASELDNVDVTWGMRSSFQEQSDWIGLRQFLMYLTTLYYPKNLVPFVELIPIFLLDESVKNSNQSSSAFEYKLSDYERERMNKTRNKITSLNSKNSGKNGIDLMSLDPFEDTKDFTGSRNLGYKIFGNVVLNPSIQNEESSKAGAIGFQSIEIQAGLAQQQGLSLITINLLDLQGNKFLDISSPWSFILNAPQINGDFYFRYGWQIEIPDYTNLKSRENSPEYKFWNHPGWKVFAKDSDAGLNKLKQIISSRAKAASNTLSLTQISTLDSIFYPGYSINKDKNTNLGVFTVERNLNAANYWIISMINPEINVNSQDGSLTASIQFRMNNAMANCLCPLSAADDTRKLVTETKESETDLYTLLTSFLKDNKKFIESDAKLKNYRDEYIDPERTNPDDWIVVNTLDGVRVEPRSIRIRFPNYVINDLNSSDSAKGANLTLRAWLSQVCEINYLTLVTMGDHGIQTVNQSSGFQFLFDSAQAGYSVNMEPPSNYAGDGFFGYSDISRLATQDDVFSFRFRGSLVEEIQIQKAENPNAQTLENESVAAEVGVNDVQTGGIDNNNPDKTGQNNPSQVDVTWNDKKRNLQNRLSKISAATIRCIGHPWIKPCFPIYIKGMNYFDGKYMVSRIKHSISPEGKFTSEIDTVRVLIDNDYARKQQSLKDSQKFSLTYGAFSGFMASNTGLKLPSQQQIIESYRTPSEKANILNFDFKPVSFTKFNTLQDNLSAQQLTVPIKKG